MDYIDALAAFGIKMNAVTQIYKSAWDIDNTYILKKNNDSSEFDRSIELNRHLATEGLKVMEFINTQDGKPYFSSDVGYYCLIRKIKGKHMNPFSGNCMHNGIILGEAVAKLQQALLNITVEQGIHEADFANEFDSWIMPELEEKQLTAYLNNGVLDTCKNIVKTCNLLPRQIIHRDMHVRNLLFENGTLSGYLDFDICQRNIRVFDICYLGCSLLVENYKDANRFIQWQEIFSGILYGYESISPLENSEIKALPGLFIFDQILFAAYFSKQNQTELVQNCIDLANWQYKNINFESYIKSTD